MIEKYEVSYFDPFGLNVKITPLKVGASGPNFIFGGVEVISDDQLLIKGNKKLFLPPQLLEKDQINARNIRDSWHWFPPRTIGYRWTSPNHYPVRKMIENFNEEELSYLNDYDEYIRSVGYGMRLLLEMQKEPRYNFLLTIFLKNQRFRASKRLRAQGEDPMEWVIDVTLKKPLPKELPTEFKGTKVFVFDKYPFESWLTCL